MKIASTKHAAIAVSAVFLAVSVSGCQLGMHVASDPVSAIDDMSAHQVTAQGSLSDSPQKTYDTKENGSVVSAKDPITDDSTATIPDATAESTSGKSGKTPPAVKSEEAWNAKAPKLLGLTLGESKSQAGAKLGKPVDSYPLTDGNDKLSVEEYAAFSVGYGSDNKVVFVDVFDKAAATGLSGLRVGDSGNAAVKALGKPDTHTSSVLAYQADKALLKLDLDPQNNRIVSIKLFSANRQPQS